MRFMTGVASLALMLALTGSAHADDWYRLNLQAPILFSGGEVLPPDGGVTPTFPSPSTKRR